MANSDVIISRLLFKVIFYVEDQGYQASTRCKHFLIINILFFWNIRLTFRSSHTYSLFMGDKEYIPKVKTIRDYWNG